MELSDSAQKVLSARYLLRRTNGDVVETPEMMFERVATAVASVEKTKRARTKWAHEFYDLMVSLTFLPNSPCLMNAGTDINQLSACFVLPIEDSMDSIFGTLYDMAMIQRTGGGTGFSFSRLRPRGSPVLGTQGVASGPVSFLRMYDAATNEIKQGGKRRGANMAVLASSHPDIMEFIHCKDSENTRTTNFNISVWADDEFIRAVLANDIYYEEDPRTGERHGVNAREIFDAIVDRAWATGDPGLVFADHINARNPTPIQGDIEAINPCGEQPLLPYESCVLGSINLGKIQTMAQLSLVVRTAVRFLDNCIDAQKYTLPAIEAMHRGNRKVGLGVMGWADYLVQRQIPYGSDVSIFEAEKTMQCLDTCAQEASTELAYEKGAYPNLQGDHPARNATVTTIAPTGSIGLIAGCSSGIEPYFALAVKRENVLGGKELFDMNPLLESALVQARTPGVLGVSVEEVMEHVREHGVLPSAEWAGDWIVGVSDIFVTAHEVSYDAHIRMQAAFQRYTDNAVSKTVNLPRDASKEDVRAALLLAHKLGCKGVTVFRDGCKGVQVLHAGQANHPATNKPVRVVAPRPSVMSGHTEKIPTGLGSLYLTVNNNGIPREVFAQIGKAGSEISAFTEALARLISLALRSDIPADEVASQLVGIGGSNPSGLGAAKVLSVPDAIGKALIHMVEHEPEGKATPLSPHGDLCPDCGNSSLQHQEGCEVCSFCGYTTC